MEENQIKEYILKYKDSYSKEQIVTQLKSSGVAEKEINRIFLNLNNKNQTKNKKKGKAKLGFFLILIGLLIPVLGYILIISGIVLGFKQRKVCKDGLSMFVIIFGFISLILGLFTQIFMFGVIMYSFVDFGSLLPNKIDLNNNIMADSSRSSFDGTNLNIAFTYVGAGKSEIYGSKSVVIDNDGTHCDFQNLRNVDIGEEGNEVSFLNGQTGVITFNCNDFDRGSFFSKKDNFEASLKISLNDSRTESETFSEGNIRLFIQE